MRGRRGKRDGQHRGDDRDRPVGRAVDPVAPTRHAGDLRAMVMRDDSDELGRSARKDRRRIVGPLLGQGSELGLLFDSIVFLSSYATVLDGGMDRRDAPLVHQGQRSLVTLAASQRHVAMATPATGSDAVARRAFGRSAKVPVGARIQALRDDEFWQRLDLSQSSRVSPVTS